MWSWTMNRRLVLAMLLRVEVDSAVDLRSSENFDLMSWNQGIVRQKSDNG